MCKYIKKFHFVPFSLCHCVSSEYQLLPRPWLKCDNDLVLFIRSLDASCSYLLKSEIFLPFGQKAEKGRFFFCQMIQNGLSKKFYFAPYNFRGRLEDDYSEGMNKNGLFFEKSIFYHIMKIISNYISYKFILI